LVAHQHGHYVRDRCVCHCESPRGGNLTSDRARGRNVILAASAADCQLCSSLHAFSSAGLHALHMRAEFVAANVY
jgi:hypothetical protein